MCPLCVGTAAWLASSGTSAGGVAAVLYRLRRRKLTEGTSDVAVVEPGGTYVRSLHAAGRETLSFGRRSDEAR